MISDNDRKIKALRKIIVDVFDGENGKSFAYDISYIDTHGIKNISFSITHRAIHFEDLKKLTTAFATEQIVLIHPLYQKYNMNITLYRVTFPWEL